MFLSPCSLEAPLDRFELVFGKGIYPQELRLEVGNVGVDAAHSWRDDQTVH